MRCPRASSRAGSERASGGEDAPEGRRAAGVKGLHNLRDLSHSHRLRQRQGDGHAWRKCMRDARRVNELKRACRDNAAADENAAALRAARQRLARRKRVAVRASAAAY